jgi:hypothetical protein
LPKELVAKFVEHELEVALALASDYGELLEDRHVAESVAADLLPRPVCCRRNLRHAQQLGGLPE